VRMLEVGAQVSASRTLLWKHEVLPFEALPTLNDPQSPGYVPAMPTKLVCNASYNVRRLLPGVSSAASAFRLDAAGVARRYTDEPEQPPHCQYSAQSEGQLANLGRN
jgi:hypothetical protein